MSNKGQVVKSDTGKGTSTPNQADTLTGATVAANTLPAKVEVSAGQRAADRLEKMNQLEILAERYDKLKTRRDGLKRFLLSSDGSKESITLKNSGGATFEISNSTCISEVLALLVSRNDGAIAATENEINGFDI